MELIEKIELDVTSENNNSESKNTSLVDYLSQFQENDNYLTYGDFNYSKSTYVRRT